MINAKLKDNKRLADKASVNPDLLRQRRAIAFQAFDIYKANVQYGIVVELEGDHELAIRWYYNCLNMEQPDVVADALDNVPPLVKHYMRR